MGRRFRRELSGTLNSILVNGHAEVGTLVIGEALQVDQANLLRNSRLTALTGTKEKKLMRPRELLRVLVIEW